MKTKKSKVDPSETASASRTLKTLLDAANSGNVNDSASASPVLESSPVVTALAGKKRNSLVRNTLEPCICSFSNLTFL